MGSKEPSAAAGVFLWQEGILKGGDGEGLADDPRERGRPARTSVGTASTISSTQLDRQRRQDSASAEPMPFPPAGWPGAASQGD